MSYDNITNAAGKREKRGKIKAANWTLKIKQYDKRIKKDPC